jgi:hypothetical protein
MVENRNSYRILVGNPEGKRPLEKPGNRLVDEIKMNLREIGWSGMDWIDVAQDEDQHGNECLGSIYRWNILQYVHTWGLSSMELARL